MVLSKQGRWSMRWLPWVNMVAQCPDWPWPRGNHLHFRLPLPSALRRTVPHSREIGAWREAHKRRGLCSGRCCQRGAPAAARLASSTVKCPRFWTPAPSLSRHPLQCQAMHRRCKGKRGAFLSPSALPSFLRKAGRCKMGITSTITVLGLR